MIRVERAHLAVAALTHPGMTGKNNEDRYAVTAFESGPQHSLARRSHGSATPVLLAVLSDGIGGHRGGEVAAEWTVNTISQFIAGGDTRYPLPSLERAVQEASQKVYDLAHKDIRLQGMGATAVISWIIGDRLYVANVGDSRIYLMRGSSISRLTCDHTWIQEALDGGLITPDEVYNHPNSHVIRRFVGSPQPPEVDLRLRLDPQESDEVSLANQGLPLHNQDIVLLCSDGLTDLVNDAEILAAFEAAPLNEAAQSLVDLACQRGGHDNITLLALQMPAEGLPQVKAPAGSRRRGCLGLALAMLVTALLVMLGFWGVAAYLDRQPKPTPTPRQTSATPLPTIQFLTVSPPAGRTLTPARTPARTPTP